MRFIIFILFFIPVLASGQTLQEYIGVALESNPGIRARNTEVQSAMQKIPQVTALPEPEVTVSVLTRQMMLPMGNQIGSISAMQMFPWPGTLDAREAEALRKAEVKTQYVEVAKNELVFKIKNAWYPLLELSEKIRIQEELLELLETDKELATQTFEQGRAPMVDAIRTDIMIDEVRTEIALLEQKRRPLEVAFNCLLNRDENIPVTVTGDLPEPRPGIAARQDSLVAQHPALAVFDVRIKEAMAAAESADLTRKPMVGAGIQYTFITRRGEGELDLPPNTGRDMIMPMASVTIPLWQKKYDAAVEEQRLMQVAYADMKQDKQNELAAMYEMTFYELEKTVQTVELLNKQMEKTQQVIDLLIATYSNAGKDFEEVLRLQRQLFRYRMEKVSLKTGYQLALAKLEYLTGD